MKETNNARKKQFLYGILFLFLMCFLCALIYKAQLAGKLDESVLCTLKSTHTTYVASVVELNADAPSATEVFLCTIPELKQITIETTGILLSEDTTVLLSLTDADTGEIYYQKEKEISDVAKKDATKHISLKLNGSLENSMNKNLILSIQLMNAEDTCIQLTANSKPGIVTSFDGDSENHKNIICQMRYSSTSVLKPFYAFLCIVLLLFLAIAYWLVVLCHTSVTRFYFPLALLLGLIIQLLIPVCGAPDEPSHMDTAYKYSNKLLMIKDTDTSGTIYKRQCDVIASDMLANDVETNSYYQMIYHTFESAGDTRLIEVSYSDSSNLMPGIVYLPAAIGLSLGRLLGCSAMLTYQLARIFNLLTFVLLTVCAIRLIPFGKNLLAGLSMLPIALQQSASASYDAIANGIIFLFIALCFYLNVTDKHKKSAWSVAICIGLFVIMIKGGAYAPLFFLLLLPLRRFSHEKRAGKKRIVGLTIAICAVAAMLLCFIIKILPVIKPLFAASQINADGEELYSLSYALKHPLNLLYLSWGTLIEVGANHLRGMLGGILGWHNIKPSWLFVFVFAICLLLFAHTSNDSYIGNRKQKIGFSCVILCSVGIIMLSMLFACTPTNASYIEGLQGRYYLPLCPLLFFVATGSMVSVQDTQLPKVWITYLTTESLMLLEVLPLII